MKNKIALKLLLSTIWILFSLTLINAKEQKMPKVYDFKLKNINGQETTLETYKGKVMIIVNVASKCGFTSQYEGLESLYKKYKEKGLVVLGFPCNQFGSQEPGTESEIQTFCKVNFGVTFPMFSKLKVNGEDTHPLYQYLKTEQSGFLGTEAIKWNFTKFLVDKEGNVLKRFGSSTKPEDLEKVIVPLLKPGIMKNK